MYGTYTNIKNSHPLYIANQYLIKPAVFGISKKLGASEGDITVSNDILEGIWSTATGDPFGAYINFDKAAADYKSFSKGGVEKGQLQTNPTGQIITKKEIQKEINNVVVPIKGVVRYAKKQKEGKRKQKFTAEGAYSLLSGAERQGVSFQDFKANFNSGKSAQEIAQITKNYHQSHKVAEQAIQQRKEQEIRDNPAI